MNPPAKPPAAPAKAPAKTANKGYPHWLSIGFFLLLVGGTFASRHLFLVDNDLEINTKFSGKSWQLSTRSIRQDLDAIERQTSQLLAPLGTTIQTQSNQWLNSAGKALSQPQNLCISNANLSTVLDGAKSLNALVIEDASHPKTSTPPTKAPSIQQKPADRDWCITTGVKK
jgi:hypothetical protein